MSTCPVPDCTSTDFYPKVLFCKHHRSQIVYLKNSIRRKIEREKNLPADENQWKPSDHYLAKSIRRSTEKLNGIIRYGLEFRKEYTMKSISYCSRSFIEQWFDPYISRITIYTD